MAESLVEFLLNELSQVLKEEINLQRGVKEEIKLIKDELESIKAFLRVADAEEEKDPQLAVWVKQVRDVAFDIEDTLDAFLLSLVDHKGHHNQRRHLKCLRKIASSYKKWKVNRQTGSKLQSIKTRVEDISNRHQRYPSLLEGDSSSRMENMEAINEFRRNALLEDESQLVGTEEPKQELIGWLLQDDSHLKVLAINGMGGLGKTTLVQQIYKNARLKDHFKSKALVTVSQSLKQGELLRELIRQLSPNLPQGIDAMNNHRLKEITKELLQNQTYLIVLDDVWKTEDWDQLKVAMPNNMCGSRVIITTRIDDVARYSTKSTEYQGMSYPMKVLSKSDSWTLFCKKTFQGEPCPSHLEQICRQIIKRCGGLPLAISTISGLLATKDVDRVEVWEMIKNSLNVELQQNPQLQMMKRIFSLSFYDLSYYLKSCFLFLSIFPEDYLIERTKMVRLWIAEGFVEEKDGRTLEQEAESYFYELLNRSLIMAITKTVDGRVKSFRIHDFLRETILSKSREENFVQVFTKENAAKLPEGARRLSILHLPHQVDISQLRSSLLSKLRSLFLFEEVTSVTVSNCSSIVSKLLSGGPKLLKVLDLEGAPLDTCPEQVSTLFLLRYLSFRKTRVSRLNIPIGNLHSLVTLDLRQTHVTVLPSEIYKLHKLRHLLICQYEDVVQGGNYQHPETREKQARVLYKTETMCSIKVVDSSIKLIDGYFNIPDIKFISIKGFKASAKIGSLVSLHKLCYLDASEEEEGDLMSELGRLVQLRRLCLMNLKGQHGSALCSSISKMQYLSSLTLHARETIDLQRLSSPPPLLKRLYLTGYLVKLPSWVSSLFYLEVLHLINSQLKEDPLKSLHSLPSLIDLTLCEAFDGDLMIIPPGGFARLKFLFIRQPHNFQTKLVVDRTAMPRLRWNVLDIKGSLDYVDIPELISFHRTLMAE